MKTSTKAKPTAAPVKRVDPETTPITSTVPMPEKQSRRGSVSKYAFADLEVGQSFGVKNKTAAGMASIVSNQNRKHKTPKLNEAGGVIYKTTIMIGADGQKTEVPTEKPEMNILKHFFANDCDPAKDPEGATVRIFRDI